MRKVSAEERALFLAALSGLLPARTMRAVAKAVERNPAKCGAVFHKIARREKKAQKAAEQPRECASVKAPADRRRASDEEVQLFLEAIGLRAKPMPAPVPVILPAKRRAAKPPVSAPAGVDGHTSKKLEKGEIAPAAKLDLHGLTEAAAHGTLLTFLSAAHHRGDRLVLVVTGKGETGHGILKRMVPRWLDEAPMVSLIADKRWAHKRHGGEGALYVYLRKPARG
jgi:DNA-nicking Smr family endonuclease